MELTTFWFIIIAVLWCGYFVLEGFDYGVGVIYPAVAKTEQERRAVLTTLGPLWDGNEVWLLVAGGATFAAFPEWYATLFSGFYLALFLILLGLIMRGVAMEYRSKRSDLSVRKRYDLMIVVGSFIPALLWGVAFANIVRGVPMRAAPGGNSLFDGNLLTLLNPYALVGGLTTLALFATHGAIFLSLKTSGTIRERAHDLAGKLGAVAAVLAVVFLGWTQLAYSNGKTWGWILVIAAALSWVAGLAADRARREGWAFLFSAITLVLAVTYLFSILFPNVMPASNDPALSLTVENASSTAYTLRIMTVTALIATPVVLAYQAWTYWVFRKRISADMIVDAEHGSLDLPGESAGNQDAERPTAAV